MTNERQQRKSAVGSPSLSGTADEPSVVRQATHTHLAAVDDWLSELERDHGPVPPSTTEWARQVVDEWESSVEIAAATTPT